jgi:hypothetical protein
MPETSLSAPHLSSVSAWADIWADIRGVMLRPASTFAREGATEQARQLSGLHCYTNRAPQPVLSVPLVPTKMFREPERERRVPSRSGQ